MKSAAAMHDPDDDFIDYGDDYDDEDYGSQSQGQYGFYDPDGNTDSANAAMLAGIEGSGGSDEYDGEDMSEESSILRQQYL